MQQFEQASAKVQALWLEILGVAPERIERAPSDDPFRHVDHFQARTLIEIKQAQDLDPTGALMLMRSDAILDDWLSKRATTALSYLDDPTAFDIVLDRARRMRTLLLESGMAETRAELQATVVRALEHYGADQRADIKALLSGRHAIGELWRDALLAMHTSLTTHQFIQGPPSTAKPKYTEHVLGFWSMADALRLASAMPDGISICLIRDARAVHSFFAFVVKAGGTLTAVTDAPEWKHPLQRMMTRRPDRHLANRMGRSRFPYELLDLQHLEDEDGEVVGLNVPRQEGIIPAQQRAFRLKRINALNPDEVVWIAMMFAHLTRRFFVEDRKLETLSYTAEMIEVPHLIESIADRNELPVVAGGYSPLRTDRIALTDLDLETIERKALLGQAPSGVNQWMVERYGHLVDEASLALVDLPAPYDRILDEGGNVVSTTRPKFHAEKLSRPEIEVVDATAFGSADRVLADRFWIARHNQASQIAFAAEQEFAAREKEMETWWTETLDRRRDFIFEAIAKGGIEVERSGKVVNLFRRMAMFENDLGGLPQFSGISIWYHVGLWGKGTSFNSLRRIRCAKSGRPATDVVLVTPEIAEDIALIAGCTVTELPELLQHWTRQRSMGGNHITERLDPMDFLPINPWHKLHVRFEVYISKHVIPR